MAYVLPFTDPDAAEAKLVGGKGRNLGLLSQAGFPVPAGFTVSTAAYQEFLAQNGLSEKIRAVVQSIDFDDVDGVDARTTQLRQLIDAAPLPPHIAADIVVAYEKLGSGTRVAVRSSGTAEDLEDASFAGQHDTYLHIRGQDSVVDAVKRCWGSLWTARATAYRQHKGFGQQDIGIAVVVQTMVDSEVSGVMFTANPIAVVTDEIGINASWGLGEAIVSGMVTPDAYTLDLGTLRVKEKTLGTKELRIRLDDTAGQGTVTEAVPATERDTFSLTDAQAAELGDLGRRVMAYYDGLPQDTEWALADGTFYLLQARPVTGASFSWDEALDHFQTVPDDPNTLWSRAMSDDGWTGAVTPLFFSFRSAGFWRSHTFANRLYGFDDVAGLKYQKYYRGTVYWNTDVDKAHVTRIAPPSMRKSLLANVSPFDHDEILNASYSYAKMLRVYARVHALAPAHGFRGWVRVQQDYIDNHREEAAGKTEEELRLLSDEALVTYLEAHCDYEGKYIEDIFIGYLLNWVTAGQLLAQVITHWYTGDNPGVLIDLLTGTEEQTFTVKENLALWELAQEIRSSKELTGLFAEYPGAEFFSQLAGSEAGRAFLAKYEPFLEQYGHRGHADRDIYFIRRAEDRAVDYRALATYLNVDGDHDPTASEESARRRKEAAFEEIVDNLRTKPLGFIKVEIFKVLNAYNQKLLVGRDNERAFIDIITFAIKRGFLELNRRLVERGLVEEDRDFYFLARHELYDLFRGRANSPLTRAKIAGRKRNFDLVNMKEVKNPMYLQDNRPVELATEDDGDPNNLKGMPTSGGFVTGTARLVKSLEEIGRVRQGEILVCNSTDPGWTPVFLLLAGAVFETGGAFAHCSCLSREYGIPAVQVLGALQRIPDGATITLNGNTGMVTIVDAPGEEPAEVDAVAVNA